MEVQNSLFDSKAEEAVFQKLDGFWEPDYRLWVHLPFANLIQIRKGDLPAVEMRFLHRTSVDFVLATKDGKPVLAIEFDGLGEGYASRGEYRQKVKSPRDPNRGWKLGLKARVADRAGFPFMIVSYDEGDRLKDADLTVLHGLIGSSLAQEELPARLNELREIYRDELEGADEEREHELVQDLVLQAEHDRDWARNPVYRAAAELEGELRAILKGASILYEPVEDGKRPPGCSPWLSDFSGRAFKQWWASLERFGVKCTVTADDYAISRTVWVRNLEGRGFSIHGWHNELAALVTVSAALKELRRGSAG